MNYEDQTKYENLSYSQIQNNQFNSQKEQLFDLTKKSEFSRFKPEKDIEMKSKQVENTIDTSCYPSTYLQYTPAIDQANLDMEFENHLNTIDQNSSFVTSQNQNLIESMSAFNQSQHKIAKVKTNQKECKKNFNHFRKEKKQDNLKKKTLCIKKKPKCKNYEMKKYEIQKDKKAKITSERIYFRDSEVKQVLQNQEESNRGNSFQESIDQNSSCSQPQNIQVTTKKENQFFKLTKISKDDKQNAQNQIELEFNLQNNKIQCSCSSSNKIKNPQDMEPFQDEEQCKKELQHIQKGLQQDNSQLLSFDLNICNKKVAKLNQIQTIQQICSTQKDFKEFYEAIQTSYDSENDSFSNDIKNKILSQRSYTRFLSPLTQSSSISAPFGEFYLFDRYY